MTLTSDVLIGPFTPTTKMTFNPIIIFLEEPDEYSSNQESGISTIKEGGTEIELVKENTEGQFRGISSPIREMNDATYRRLHGTNVTKATEAEGKKERRNSSDIDIFDELC